MNSARVLAALSAAALLIAGCGSTKKSDTATTGTNAAAAAATTATTPAPKATTGQAPAVPNAKDLSHKPVISPPQGTPPKTLIEKDLVVGKGPAIKPGQMATVQYVGVSWSDGSEFDASWNRGQPFQFPVGRSQVIVGWDKGVPGMRVGGRRELVIPPGQAYGPQGQPPIGPNETLVFVIDLKRIG